MSRIFHVTIAGELFEIVVDEITPGRNGMPPITSKRAQSKAPAIHSRPQAAEKKIENNGKVTAAMPGSIIAVMVEEGQMVELGQPLLVLEAMKMENEIIAPKAGKITSLKVKVGDKVDGGDILCMIE